MSYVVFFNRDGRVEQYGGPEMFRVEAEKKRKRGIRAGDIPLDNGDDEMSFVAPAYLDSKLPGLLRASREFQVMRREANLADTYYRVGEALRVAQNAFGYVHSGFFDAEADPKIADLAERLAIEIKRVLAKDLGEED